MAIGLSPGRIFQWGKESTKGTAVAATERILMEEMTFTPMDTLERPKLQRGFLIRNVGDEFTRVRGTNFTGRGPLTTEQLHSWLSASVAGNITPTGSGLVRSWNHARNPSALPAFDALSLQARYTDGSSTDDLSFAYAMLRSWELSGTESGRWDLSVDGFARRVGSETFTTLTGADLQPVVEPIMFGRTSFHMDDTNTFGVTSVGGVILAFTCRFLTGLKPQHVGDNRSTLDFTRHVFDARETGFELSMTVLCDPNVSTNGSLLGEKSKAEIGAMRYIRLAAFGRDPGGGTPVSVGMNFCAKHEAGSVFQVGEQNGQDIVEFRFVESTDGTTSWFHATVTNTRAAVCDGTPAS